MTLYSGATCVYSHTSRIVLFEKDVECQIDYVDDQANAAELAEQNPYAETPTLVDRDLVLYDYRIINEYLDERLPHPPLMPVDPVARGRARLMIMRIDRDWFQLVPEIERGDKKTAEQARHAVRDGLIALSPLFAQQPFMMGEEFTLVDCCFAPLLWRLPLLGIQLPRQASPMLEYAARLFTRKSFKLSLSDAEREMRR